MNFCTVYKRFSIYVWYIFLMVRTLSTNKLTNHPAYPKIIAAYNMQLKEKGKVNALAFYRDVVLKEIPDYDQSSWYFFLKRFKTSIGIVPATAVTHSEAASVPAVTAATEELATTMLSNNEALQKSIAAALNISASALRDILENPELLSAEKRAELFLKVMKAQDSRVKAIGTIRADNREQERFDRAMDNAAFA